jgi:RNA polymerase sigma-70 factor (ECF subfamily)
MDLSVGGGSSAEPRIDDETALLLRARTDPEAFGALYDATHEQLLRFFLVRTGSGPSSADLCAETYACALESLDRFDPARGNGWAWLYGIARNLLRQYLRKERVSRRARQRLGIRFTGLELVDYDRINALVDYRPRVAAITAALQALPDATRDAVLLRIVEELDYDEIARRLSTSPGNARVRVCRGLDRLEELLGGHP